MKNTDLLHLQHNIEHEIKSGMEAVLQQVNYGGTLQYFIPKFKAAIERRMRFVNMQLETETQNACSISCHFENEKEGLRYEVVLNEKTESEADENDSWPPKWWNGLTDWFNGDKNYSGSGWGHGARTRLSEALSLDHKASNIFETGVKSMLHAKSVTLEGQALHKIAVDPAMMNYESKLIDRAKADPKFGKQAFSFFGNSPIQFGGKRAPADMWDQLKKPFNPKYADTWKVAANELTWLVRNTAVSSTIGVDKEGKMTIKHRFSDVFDLRPSNERTSAYNITTLVLGYIYHDLAGGNDEMRIKASWEKTYQLIEKD